MKRFKHYGLKFFLKNKKNITCGVIYRHHNSPDRFQEYFNEINERFSSTGNPIYIMGDTNLDLLKCQTSSFSHDFLLSLQSCYLIPTIDKPTRIHRTSVTLIDTDTFVNNPDQVYASGNIITDVSDPFSQFCFKIGRASCRERV